MWMALGENNNVPFISFFRLLTSFSFPDFFPVRSNLGWVWLSISVQHYQSKYIHSITYFVILVISKLLPQFTANKTHVQYNDLSSLSTKWRMCVFQSALSIFFLPGSYFQVVPCKFLYHFRYYAPLLHLSFSQFFCEIRFRVLYFH